ncbi:hypothetical protein PbJCM13498_33300 [Prolixibacter bellariivorans]|uniref:Uncharacterized protein n=1 Tax=Prolixibacter bellariivorans TaxID=314319 RepID=A0A5M4B462_9BACT|nr:hypothetical protein [Prolixibacter bellariivorans]GET34467.1 hypothetical protein PbJCM13498_33300 [Prolixibacter bellariivorans]
MMVDKISMLKANTLELHYWFNDESHTMDALIQNRCEYELLGILKEVASVFNVEVRIETEPFADGGLRRWFQFGAIDPGKKATIKIALITALVTGVVVTPITTTISTVTNHLIEEIFEDKEIKELEKEKLKLEIEKLKREAEKNNQRLDNNYKLKKKRSNFYEYLNNYKKVDKVSIIIEDKAKKPIVQEKFVNRANFNDFIIVNDDLEPIEVEDAVIDIISPVLKKGRYMWYGIFKGESIRFNMKSNEFKTLVQTGKIEFRNDSSINCCLQIRRKIDSEGLEKIVGYDVLRVNYYFEDNKAIETPEGKLHKQRKNRGDDQLTIF